MASKRVHPFSNGSQFMDWEARNCDRCVKRCRDDMAMVGPCEIQNAIFRAMGPDDGFDPEMAKRMGYKHDEVQYTWRCPEFDVSPHVYCAHCLKEIKTEDELVVSERCGECGGDLSLETILEQPQYDARVKADAAEWEAAWKDGLIR